MALNNPDLISNIESLNLDDNEKDPILIEVESDHQQLFPVSTSAHRLTLEDGQVVEAIRSRFSDRNFLLLALNLPPTHVFEITRKKVAKKDSSSEYVYNVNQLSGSDSVELSAAGKFVSEFIDFAGKPLILALGFKDPDAQLTPAFVRSLAEQVKALGSF